MAQNSNYVFEHLTIEDGLSQSSVKSIFQDSRGFMWFGTQDGLNRYDGYSFKIFHYNSKDSSSISNNIIQQIAEGKNGKLWIATANGLNRYCTFSERFRRIKFPHQPNNNSGSENITSIVVQNVKGKEYIWVSTEVSIIRYFEEKNEFVFFPKPKGQSRNSFTLALFKDSNNDIWFLDYTFGLFKFNYQSQKFDRLVLDKLSDLFSESQFSKIHEDNEKNLWFGTKLGLVKYNLVNGKTERYLAPFEKSISASFKLGFITAITSLDNNNLLVGSSGTGVFIFNKKDHSVQNFRHNSSDNRTLAHNVILDLFRDKSGIIWIGTNGYGVDKFNKYLSKFNFVAKTENGLSSQSVRSIYEDYYRNIWIAGYFGLDKYDPVSGKFKHYFSSALNNNFSKYINNVVYCFAPDKENPERYFYLGTEGSGLLRFDLKTETFQTIYPKKEDSLAPGYDIINAVLDDGKGYLWVGTIYSLLRIDKKTNSIKTFRHDINNPESIGSEGVTCIYEDSKKNLWVGTNFGGLCLMNKEKGTFKSFQSNIKNKNSISDNYIKWIFEDSKKNLWIATTNGLNKMLSPNGDFKSYTMSSGLPNTVIYGILEDKEGYLWVSTNNGLSRFDPVKEIFRNYDVRDGLQSNEFNSYAFCRAKDGMLYFGGIKGFNCFKPSELINNLTVPQLSIIDIYLFNKPILPNKTYNGRNIISCSISRTREIVLNYSENVLSISFAALDYASVGKNNYSYKLEGFDEQWSMPSNNRFITYTNLDPGEYTFKVIGSNNDGIWNTTGTSLRIIITPPYWQTWWFLTIVALVITQAVYSLYRWRLKRVEKTNKFLELQVKQRTAELNKLNESLKSEVTERTSAEEELRLLNVKKDKFFSIIAHDLKSPFHGILGYAELLAEDYNNLSEEERITFINDIHNISKSTFRFLENLLEWSRIQTGRIEFEPQNINLNEEIFEVFNILFAFAIQKGISLVNNIDQEISVYADKNQLSLILRNLISNAIKFSNDTGQVIINAAYCDSHVEISVSDNGVGITPENLKKLFRIDTQYTSKGTKNEEGTGLGLLLCKEMIEINKGSIRAESEPGIGTKFIFTLPKVPAVN
jgi:signal transduction histidine kinase/ligand-binding sensor domain-containing protein